MSDSNKLPITDIHEPTAQANPIETLEILLRLRRISQDLDSAKALYAEQDSLVQALLERGFKDTLLPDGTLVQLHDNFFDAKTNAPKNVAWKSCGVRRFEIDFTNPLSAKRSKGTKS